MAAVGGTTAGATVAQATDHHEDLDRPRTIEENGIEITKWDCSRVIIEDHTGQADSVNVLVVYMGHEMMADPDDPPQLLPFDLQTGGILPEFDGRLDVNVNEYTDVVQPAYGSVVIDEVTVYDTGGDMDTVRVSWPRDEWDCDYVMEQEVE